MSPEKLLATLNQAFNNRDVDGLISCLADEYTSEQPVYPDRAFQGKEQVRKNWSSSFIEMPDFSSRIVRKAIDGNNIWTEWDWQGTRRDGSKLSMRGVTIFSMSEGKIISGKLYMQPVQKDGSGIEAAVKEVMQGKKS